MSLQDDIALLDEAKRSGEAALVAADRLRDAMALLGEQLSQQVNRYILVRGALSPPSLDRAIGLVEGAIGRVDRMAAEVDEVEDVVQAAINFGDTYRRNLHL